MLLELNNYLKTIIRNINDSKKKKNYYFQSEIYVILLCLIMVKNIISLTHFNVYCIFSSLPLSLCIYSIFICLFLSLYIKGI